MEFMFNDGGRKAAGFDGTRAGDCVTRAIAIATGKTYETVYLALLDASKSERRGSRKRGISHPNKGVYSKTARKYLASLGWAFIPTMGIGTGCKVHLKASELPKGRIIVSLSKHYAAVVDGVINDTHDCSRNETRCVYGYYVHDPMVAKLDAGVI